MPGPVAKVGIVVGMEAEARIARRLGVTVAVGGGGEAGAAEAVAALLAGGATSLISFGLCGGLDRRLRPGEIVIPEAVVADGGQRWPVDPGLRARLGAGEGGVLYAGPVLVTAGDKQNAHRTLGAAVVDVESGAVARSGLPFAVLRAVCDPAERGLPHAARVALDGRGRINGLRVLLAVLTRPQQIGALIVLARDAGRARRALLGRVRALGHLEQPLDRRIS